MISILSGISRFAHWLFETHVQHLTMTIMLQFWFTLKTVRPTL